MRLWVAGSHPGDLELSEVALRGAAPGFVGEGAHRTLNGWDRPRAICRMKKAGGMDCLKPDYFLIRRRTLETEGT